MADAPFDLPGLRAAYASGALTPSSLIATLYPKLLASGCIFIHLQPLDLLQQRCAELEAVPVVKRGILWGVPFAAKDNVDIAGMPTTAACPAFKYAPKDSAPAVATLLIAGRAEVSTWLGVL